MADYVWKTTNPPKIKAFFTNAACSYDGTKIVGITIFDPTIYRSTDSGTTWNPIYIENAQVLQWHNITSNASGSQLAVTSQDIYGKSVVYISTDSGATWVNSTNDLPNNNYTSITSNSSGSQLAIVGSDDIGANSFVYLSTTSGNSWNEITNDLPTNNIYISITSNSSGSQLAVCSLFGTVYFSTTSGNSWNEITNDLPLNVTLQSITSNASGTQLAVVGVVGNDSNQNTNVYISNDPFTSWVNSTNDLPNYIYNSITSNDTSSILTLYGSDNVTNYGISYISYNSGTSWQKNSNHLPQNSNYWTIITSNGDGSQLAAGLYGSGTIYIYKNKTWKQVYQKPVFINNSITSNDSGSLLAFCGFSQTDIKGEIYVSTDYGETWNLSANGLSDTCQFNSITSNSSGSQLAVCGNDLINGYPVVYIYTKDTNTWTLKTNGLSNSNKIFLSKIASNGDGSKLVVCGFDILNNHNVVYFYENNTWTLQDTLSSIILSSLTSSNNIVSNASGNQIVTCGVDNNNNGFVYLYNGSSWKNITQDLPVKNMTFCFLGLTSNASGSIISLSFYNNLTFYLYIYNGSTWTLHKNGLPKYFFSFGINGFNTSASNASGNQLAITSIGYNGGIYITEPLGHEPEPPISNICFAANTLVLTDQGYIAIEQIDPSINTLNGGQEIQAITKTRSQEPYWICIQKHALDHNIPFQKTRISAYHKIYYEGAWVPAYELADRNIQGIKKIVYHDEPMYNVLLKKHGSMIANGLTTETLNPRSQIAAYFRKKQKQAIKCIM